MVCGGSLPAGLPHPLQTPLLLILPRGAYAAGVHPPNGPRCYVSRRVGETIPSPSSVFHRRQGSLHLGWCVRSRQRGDRRIGRDHSSGFRYRRKLQGWMPYCGPLSLLGDDSQALSEKHRGIALNDELFSDSRPGRDVSVAPFYASTICRRWQVLFMDPAWPTSVALAD
jgi:hypothetical protein